MAEEQKEQNTFRPGQTQEKPSLFKDGVNPESMEIEDPEELEKMEEMWSKMFQRIVDEGKLVQLVVAATNFI